jgi:hypothetical protein
MICFEHNQLLIFELLATLITFIVGFAIGVRMKKNENKN